MSGQMPDIIVIDGNEYAIVEPTPGVLFEPRDHGIFPVTMHTASTRGELARFRIQDARLILSDLQVGNESQPVDLDGVTPTTDEFGQTWTYLGVDRPIDFSGDIIAGSGPIQELFVAAGFPPVWHYETVIALDIEAGVVEAQEDRSGEVAEFRAEQTGADEDDENAFERLLSAIRLRLPGFE